MDNNEPSRDSNGQVVAPIEESNNVAHTSNSSTTSPQTKPLSPAPATSTITSEGSASTATVVPGTAPSASTTTTTTSTIAPATTGTSSTTTPTTETTVTSAPGLTPATSTAPTANSSSHMDTASAPPDTTPECQKEITPMMVPDPMCPTCYNEFVEKIETDNDPRAFAPPPSSSSIPAHFTGGVYRSSEGHRSEGEEHRPINLEDLFHLFQAFYAPQRSYAQRQRQQETDRQQQHGSNQFLPTGTRYTFTSGPSGITRTVTPFGPAVPISGQGSQQPSGGNSGNTTGESTAPGTTDGQRPSAGPQWHSPPSFINGLLNRLGIEIHYTTDPAAFEGFGGPLGMGMGIGGGYFPIVGNPGDYAWGQRGLDDIISQLMELQNRQHGPVGATDEIINAIPHHTLTDEELEAKLECSVCKEEFTKSDTLLQLPCKHIFHEDCIKPWLKVSGTCPTCRYSLVGGQDGQHNGSSSSPHGNQGNNTNNNTSSTSPPPPPASSGWGMPGSFPSNRSNDNNSNNARNNSQTGSDNHGNANHDIHMEPLD
ncbi:hypothetical protein FBU30_009184 [Linnemannia zychae]|nr:hypothetical protein FBU30_009184 [Linnemannia zychae]